MNLLVRHRLQRRIVTGMLLLAPTLAVQRAPAHAADGVVGSGTPASCSESAFDTALGAVQGSGGGALTFNCGATPHTIAFAAQKSITANVAIDGAGLITLDGGNATRLFSVQPDTRLTLSGLTLSRGSAAEGGAILNNGSMVARDSVFSANRATSFGGAISSYGLVTLTNTSIISNAAASIGGGVSNYGTLIVNGGVIADNRATGASSPGGGLYNRAVLTVTNATISNNSAVAGGGIYASQATTFISNTIVQSNSALTGAGITQLDGDIKLVDVLVADHGLVNNSLGYPDKGGGLLINGAKARIERVTFQNNAGDLGGALYAEGATVQVLNATIAANFTSGSGAGIYVHSGQMHLTHVTVSGNTISTPVTPTAGIGVHGQPGAMLIMTHTLLTGNVTLPARVSGNCGGTLVVGAQSLSSDGSCAFGGGRDGIALPLGPLQNNGGFAPTQLLPQGSPAIDAGAAASCLPADQRGVARPVGASCDVGAIEARDSDFARRVFMPLAIRSAAQ